MRVEVPIGVEEQLRDLAARQGRQLETLVEEALRQYLEAAAITDVDASHVAEAQSEMLKELPDIPAWKARGA